MKIITITLNPAFDIHCFCENFQAYHENLAEITSKDAGGKGINISRALIANGTESTAVIVLGEENADDFCKALPSCEMKVKEIRVKGRIRENITLHSNNSPETRISFKGFCADDSLLEKVSETVLCEIESDTVITFTGSIPTGVSLTAAKEMLCEFKKMGAKIVIDSKSFKMNDILDCSPWLIKPNGEEIAEYAGRILEEIGDAAKEAEKIRKQGVENVMISLGDMGAALACDSGIFIARAPQINAVSTIGAGDSSIAGFLVAVKNTSSPRDMLKTAVAYGTAACMSLGTQPPKKDDILTLLERTVVNEMNREERI